MVEHQKDVIIRNGVNVASCPWFIKGSSATDVFECFNDELTEYVCSSNKCKYKEYIKNEKELESKKEVIKACSKQLFDALSNTSYEFADFLDDISHVAHTLNEVMKE